MSGLEKTRNVYGFWGRHAWPYKVLSALTIMGRGERIRRVAVQSLELIPGGRVLELACGTGLNLPFLYEAVGPGGSIIGLDYTPEMLDAARNLVRKQGLSNVTFYQGDAAALDIPESDLDGVLSILGISAMHDPAGALRRAYQVLRPGGMLSVCDARPFSGVLSAFNPLIKALYRKTAAWDPDLDLPGMIEAVFGNVRIETFNAGSFFVARARKDSGSAAGKTKDAAAKSAGKGNIPVHSSGMIPLPSVRPTSFICARLEGRTT